jgi:hypothetical protein
MNHRAVFIGALLVASAVVLAACGARDVANSAAIAPSDDSAGDSAGALGAREDLGFVANDAAEAAMAPAPAALAPGSAALPTAGNAVPAATPLPDTAGVSDATARKIIKDATLSLEVESVPLSLSRLDGIAAQSGGYVLETQTDGSDPSWKRANIRMAVPVDQFEIARQRIREAAVKVLTEQASGVDVSQEYVDVQSQIANLEATQARVRQFLEQSNTVEEALKVNAELTRIEGDLSQLKGRMQYLSQRSAFSTIAVALQEPEPKATVTATPTVTPTPTPRPPWQPGQSTRRAVDSLSGLLQLLGDLAIWLAVVVLPIVLIVAVLVALIRWAVLAIRKPRA